MHKYTRTSYSLHQSKLENEYFGLSNTPVACDFGRGKSACTSHKHAHRSHVFLSLRRFHGSRIRWPDAMASRPYTASEFSAMPDPASQRYMTCIRYRFSCIHTAARAWTIGVYNQARANRKCETKSTKTVTVGTCGSHNPGIQRSLRYYTPFALHAQAMVRERYDQTNLQTSQFELHRTVIWNARWVPRRRLQTL
jgi:hypothetical protein